MCIRDSATVEDAVTAGVVAAVVETVVLVVAVLIVALFLCRIDETVTADVDGAVSKTAIGIEVVAVFAGFFERVENIVAADVGGATHQAVVLVDEIAVVTIFSSAGVDHEITAIRLRATARDADPALTIIEQTAVAVGRGDIEVTLGFDTRVGSGAAHEHSIDTNQGPWAVGVASARNDRARLEIEADDTARNGANEKS